MNELVEKLKCGFIGSRDSVEEGYADCLDMLEREGVNKGMAMTAVGVLMNSIAKEIEKIKE